MYKIFMGLFLSSIFSFSLSAQDFIQSGNTTISVDLLTNSYNEQVGAKLNQLAKLSDLGPSLCFSATPIKGCLVFTLLANLENENFYNGDHTYVTSFNCSVKGDQTISLEYSVFYDMAPADQREASFSYIVNKCPKNRGLDLVL